MVSRTLLLTTAKRWLTTVERHADDYGVCVHGVPVSCFVGSSLAVGWSVGTASAHLMSWPCLHRRAGCTLFVKRLDKYLQCRMWEVRASTGGRILQCGAQHHTREQQCYWLRCCANIQSRSFRSTCNMYHFHACLNDLLTYYSCFLLRGKTSDH